MTRQVALAAIGSFLVTVTIFSLWSPKKVEAPPAPAVVVAPPPRPELMRPARLPHPILVDSQLAKQRRVEVTPLQGERRLPGAFVIEADAGTP